MEPIDVDKAQSIAQKKGLKPARVKGTEIIQFTREGGSRFEIIQWPDFQSALDQRGLQVFESSGWMKIMKPDE